MGWNGLNHIASLTTDFERNELEVLTVDGRVVRQNTEAQLLGSPSDFKRVTWRRADRVMTILTTWDEELEVEVFERGDQVARMEGRPVIYLDQNIWIRISQALYRPDLVREPELSATLQLVARARSHEIILPISSAHWIETGPTYGLRRTQLASLMVGLSRGWIMQDPLLAADAELKALFRGFTEGTLASIQTVFTLDHRDLFAGRPAEYVPNDKSLPPESLGLVEALTGISSTLAVLLGPGRTEPEGLNEALRWADLHQEFGRYVASRRRDSSALRKFTLGAFLESLGHGLVEAARNTDVSVSDLRLWRETRAEEDLARLPYLGRQRELVHLRLMNTEDMWEPNDLIDVLYLTCAAAYAAYVVCENKTGDYLRRVARHYPGGARVVSSVADLLEALETRGRSPDST